MTDDDDIGWALPAFDAGQALVQLQRALRALRLGQRADAFELRDKAVLQLTLEDGVIEAQLARRPALTPEWDRFRVRSGADQRKLLDELRRRLQRWQDED
ncbi:MAG: hypothetical protein LC125_07290 [Burkholderiales bacterium]|nr:hypothetical protein [Burkholderiales bacterium]